MWYTERSRLVLELTVLIPKKLVSSGWCLKSYPDTRGVLFSCLVSSEDTCGLMDYLDTIYSILLTIIFRDNSQSLFTYNYYIRFRPITLSIAFKRKEDTVIGSCDVGFVRELVFVILLLERVYFRIVLSEYDS